jgi:hypothetical protein
MFTLEINGKPIAVTNADEAQARAVFEDDDFKTDLRSLQSDGKPVWNGTDALVVRPASEDEVAAFEDLDEEDEDDDDDDDDLEDEDDDDDDSDEDDDADDDEDDEEEDEDEGVEVLFLVPLDEDA